MDGVVVDVGALQPYLDDVTIEEIWVNEPGRVFVARAGRSELTTTVLPDGTVEHLVARMLQSSGVLTRNSLLIWVLWIVSCQ